MGTTFRVVVVGGPLGLAGEARAHLARLEARWSRFVPTSDVSRLNARPGTWVDVHPDTVRVVATAADAWRRSAGRFDPTVHDALVALGYDRSFERISAPSASSALPVTDVAVPGAAGIAVDAEESRLRLPYGVRLDLGGIGKGFAADLVAERLVARGAAGALVDVGGDLRATGASPGGRGWTVDVQHPLHPAEDVTTLSFADGAEVGVATSSTLGRRWCQAGRTVHHLLDPRTGRPLDGPAVAATVVAARAWLADVACKVVLSGDEWPAGLGPELPALVFDAAGAVRCRGDLVLAPGAVACSPR